METKIYNIDSIFRNITKYPDSANFKYNIVDTTSNIIPFHEKNVIEINIKSIEIPISVFFINTTRGNNTFTANESGVGSHVYTIPSGSYTSEDLVDALNLLLTYMTFDFISTSNKILIKSNSGNTHTITFSPITTGYLSLGELLGFPPGTYNVTAGGVSSSNTTIIAQDKYFFLRINELGNIINNNTNYVAKIILDTRSVYSNTNIASYYDYISSTINLNQPQDIRELNVSLEDYRGNLISLNGCNFSFTIELKIITNTILKNYEQIVFYSEPVMQRILQAKMLAYYEKQVSENVNNSLTNSYNNNLVNFNNKMEYTSNGNRNNYTSRKEYADIKNN